MDIQKFCNDINTRVNKGDNIILAIEGMAASGKSTFALKLKKLYDCEVISMDHFFLRPELRTPARLDEPGGNIDYERFLDDVVCPLKSGLAFTYRPFDCGEQKLTELVYIARKQLIIIEGVYSMHPYYSDVYNMSVFLYISEQTQKERLLARNPDLYQRFINEWIPMENKYFNHFSIQDKCDYLSEGYIDE